MVINFKGSKKFKIEIESWLEDKIITEQQAGILYNKYDLLKDPPWYLRSSFILKGIALILLGMGMLLLISENWNNFNIPVRMMFGIVPMAVAYAFGFNYLYKEQKDAAELAFFFANIMLGVNIFLQAQIFHISSYFPNGVLWWIIGSIPVAIYFKSNLHNFLIQVTYIIWLSMQLNFDQFSFWSIAIFGTIVYLLYLKPNIFQFLLAVISMYFFIFNINWSIYGTYKTEFPLMFGSIALLLTTITPFFKEQYSESFLSKIHGVGVLIILIILYFLTFSDIIDEFARTKPTLTTYVILGVSLILYFKEGMNDFTNWAYGMMIFFILFHQIAANSVNNSTAEREMLNFAGVVITNIIFMAHLIWRIRYGMVKRIKRHFMFGIFLLFILALTRYIDFFEDYILTSIIFILGGIALFVLNNYWNKKYEVKK